MVAGACGAITKEHARKRKLAGHLSLQELVRRPAGSRKGGVKAESSAGPAVGTNVSHTVVLFVNSGGYEVAWQVTSLGITAAAMGDDVTFVFAFEALRALARARLRGPLRNDRERTEVTRGEKGWGPAPSRMIQDARAMGAFGCVAYTCRCAGCRPRARQKRGSG